MYSFANTLYSQNYLFIKPIINKRTSLTSMNISAPSVSSAGLYNFQKTASNPYFDFRPLKFSKVVAINVGIGIGGSFDNNKHLLSVEICTDDITSGSVANYLYKSTNNLTGEVSYADAEDYFLINQATYRLSFDYSVKLFNIQKSTIYLNTNLNFLHSNGDINSGGFNNLNTELLYNGAYLNKREFFTSYIKGMTTLLGIGIQTDINLKVKNKTFYLFSFNVGYKQGFKRIEVTTQNFKIIDNNEIFSITYYTTNRGSGIYFEVSRRFQIFPWKPLLKKKHQITSDL